MKIKFRTAAAGPTFSAQPGETVDTVERGISPELAKALIASGNVDEINPAPVKPVIAAPAAPVVETAKAPIAPATAKSVAGKVAKAKSVAAKP